MPGSIIHVNDDQFDDTVIKSEIPVLVDFWAEWCGPCKMLTPVLEDIAGEYQGKLTIVKVNVDENNSTAAKFRVQSIPHLVLFKDGNVVLAESGLKTKSQLLSLIDPYI